SVPPDDSPYLSISLSLSLSCTHTHNLSLSPSTSYLPTGVDTIAIEIYDDCLITNDTLIAWASYKIPERFLRFTDETLVHNFEERISLSGKLGEGMEGDLSVVFTSKVGPGARSQRPRWL